MRKKTRLLLVLSLIVMAAICCLSKGMTLAGWRDMPMISTEAVDSETGTHFAIPADEMMIIDTVCYEGLEAGKRYSLEGVLMDRARGRPLTDNNGNQIHSTAEFIADNVSGSIDVRFVLNGKNLSGTEVVVFEYLRQDGETVASHGDITSEEQTVTITDAGSFASGRKKDG